MHLLLYLRLVVLTAGTLLPFFWIVVILGHRRQRNFERVFFFLCLALTCFFGSSLLALNAQLFYATPPQGLLLFAWICVCVALWFIPSLVIRLNVEYGFVRGMTATNALFWRVAAWAPALLLSPFLFRALRQGAKGNYFEFPSILMGLPFQIWLSVAMGFGSYWQWRFKRAASDREQRSFHRILQWDLLSLAIWGLILSGWEQTKGPGWSAPVISLALMIFTIAPLGLLVSKVRRFNFLQIGRQRNLIYAVFGIFVALMYLSFVRRASQWLEPFLPPEAAAALLLFLPVVFFEPLQRLVRRLLRQTAQTEVDRAQKLMGPINEMARLGDLEKLREFSELWITEQLQLASVRIGLDADMEALRLPHAERRGAEDSFEIHYGTRHIGTLTVRSYGAMASGETYAALEFVAEQLPAAFDLCRLIEEKLQLERELAERERLALVGQMAASISHNLKNPLGSIKTILQVQMESPELPEGLRAETQMVLDEINRLSGKLNQLLQFSRPGVRVSDGQDRCDAARVAGTVSGVFRHEAEQRGIALELQTEVLPQNIAASAEVMHDILSNLLLNALEAAPSGGHVRMSLQASNGSCRVSIEDDGAGVSPALREKILQPFFTTKTRGTGLGLAIVLRRVEEIGGTLEVQSPIEKECGSRFTVTLPFVAKEGH